jgi:carbonic anhydrase
VILGCSDSRVPVELVFDQGLGDLFVVRVAGNIVANSQIGSIEYAVQVLGARLVVVLGHSHCGAVQATLEAMKFPNPPGTGKIISVVDRIRPALEPLLRGGQPDDNENLVQKAVRANIEASLSTLESESQIIQELLKNRELMLMGAEYDLSTGMVEFLRNR